jgi:hypothetical protein
MNSIFKPFALFMAAFAFSVATASSASAVGFHGESEPTYLTSSGSFIVQVEVGTKINCLETNIHDHNIIGTATQEEVVVTPTFRECNTVGLSTHPVNSGSCRFTFKVTTKTTGDMAIVGCSSPLQYVVTKTAGVVECTVTITNQVPGVPTVTYAAGTKSGKPDVAVTFKAEKVAYTTDPPHGTVCGTAGLAKITGISTLFGFKDTAHIEPTGVTIA